MVDFHLPHNAFRFRVEEPSDISECKRLLKNLKGHPSFKDSLLNNAQLIIAELGSNLVKYAVRGEIQLYFNSEAEQIEILSLDSGPGMEDIYALIPDGVSTGGTLGHGLGAIDRLSKEVDYFSIPKKGTYIKAIVGDKSDTDNSLIDIARVVVPIAGETSSGDWVSYTTEDDKVYFMHVDGLGHGPDAAKAATAIGNYFDQNFHKSWQVIWEELNLEARSTRGGAVGMGYLDLEHGEIEYAGTGNILASVINYQEKSRHLISMPGILGKSSRLPKIQRTTFKKGDIFISCSDGLKSITNTGLPTRLFGASADMVAAYLFKQYIRNTDDASILIIKH